MNKPVEPCLFLDWDTKFFGFRIAKTNANRLTPDLMVSVLDWCQVNTIDCLYFLTGSNDNQTIRLAEDNGFRLVEIRYTFEYWLKNWDPNSRLSASDRVAIRPVGDGDVPILQNIARFSYQDSRYIFDQNFSEEICQEYYATWIKNSCAGRAEMVLVAEANSKIVGYISGNRDKKQPEGRLELTAVLPEYQRHGVGQELFRSALDWYVRAGVDHITVETQGRNIKTQRMIQRHGFLSHSTHLFYHKWFTS
jgi:dTDP-4-amino-4,6-dideoxy-D-galactose acyltransferase